MPEDTAHPAATPPEKSEWRRLLTPRHVAVAVTVLIGACVMAYAILYSSDNADLRTGHIAAETPNYPLGAVPYSLPRAVFTIKSTTKLTGCTDVDTQISRGSWSERVQGEILRGATRITVARSTEVDPGQQYYLYFDSARKSKSLDFDVETYGNGTLKTLSASIHDQVAPIAAATLGGVTAILEHAFAMGGAARRLPVTPHCADLDAAISTNPNDPRLTLTQEDRWTPDRPGTISVAAGLDRLQRQFQLVAPQWARANAILSIDAATATARATATAGAQSSTFDFPHPGCTGGAAKCNSTQPPLIKGLVLRNAVVAQLTSRVCDANCDATPMTGALGSDDDLTTVAVTSQIVPQFGNLLLVPVHSGFAQNASVDVAMSAEGLVTLLRLKTTNALAATITNVGGNIGTVAGVGAAPDTPPR